MDNTYRGSCTGQVTKNAKLATEYLHSSQSKLIDNNPDELDIIEEELTVFLDRMINARDNLIKANEAVRGTVSSLNVEELERDCEKITEYEDVAVSVIARLKQRLSKFSGNLREWSLFWEQYRTAIHENNTLSTIDKFNYLQSVLCGRAAEAIAGFTPTEHCYDAAITLLRDEYGSIEKVIDKHMQQLLSINPVASRSDVCGLRQLYNLITACTRSLTALGVPSSHYYIMLKSVLLRWMPKEMRVDFYRSYKQPTEDVMADNNDDSHKFSSATSLSNGDHQTKALVAFLKNDVESLEKSNEASRNSFSRSSHSQKTAAGLFTATSNKSECFLCKSSVHTTEDCNATLSITQRKSLLKANGRCFRCTRSGHTSKYCKVRVFCKRCKKGRHASSMCEPVERTQCQPVSGNMISNQSISRTMERVSDAHTAVSQPAINLYAGSDKRQPLTQVYLQTAKVLASSERNTHQLLVRVIFDGGSQMSFVRENVSRKLNLPKIGSHQMRVVPFGSREPTPMKECNLVGVFLKSQFGGKRFYLEVVQVPDICCDILSIPNQESSLLCDFQLADVKLSAAPYEEGITILIGKDQYWKLTTGKIKRLTDNLTAIETVFGWTIQGPSHNSCSAVNVNLIPTMPYSDTTVEQFDFKKFWDLEAIGISTEMHTTEYLSEDFASKCIVRKKDHYIASLPWKSLQFKLKSNRKGALHRTMSLVRKLSQRDGKLKDYDQAMCEFITAGYAEPVSTECDSTHLYYLPHKPVYREDKDTTKLRIVFDGSAHEQNQLSLNDHLFTGPNLLPDLLKVLLRFRLGRIGITADIEKAFLQIHLDEKERDSHRFFWFAETLDSLPRLPPITEYRLTRVTFGVTCSPFILNATLSQHIQSEAKSFPETCTLLNEHFYMDNLVVSVDSEKAARRLYKDAVTIMKRASMNLRKWHCNNALVSESFVEQGEQTEVSKVLGIRWFIGADELSIDIEPVIEFIEKLQSASKRIVLKTLSRIYDPFGMIAPYTIRLKILFQRTWKHKLDWDADLPDDLRLEWNSIINDAPKLKELAVPRFILSESNALSYEVHIFSDASLRAYGCVAYLRVINKSFQVSVRMLIANSRVVPLKEENKTTNADDKRNTLTLPCLELTATLLSARLCAYLHKVLKIKFQQFFWVDSKIALFWIKGRSRKWKSYVQNQVKEIGELSHEENWHYCPGNQNPADHLTRGLTAEQLLQSNNWNYGPDWLSSPNESRPEFDSTIDFCMMLASLQVNAESDILTIKEPLLYFCKYSRWGRLLRITAYCLRFVDKIKQLPTTNPNSKVLTTCELQRAELYWITYIQRIWFKHEIHSIINNQKLPSISKINELNPVLDDQGTLRMTSRLRLLDSFASTHPIIMPNESYLSELIVLDMHERTLHGGINLVSSRIREKYWIVRAKQLIRKVIRRCVFCKQMYGKPVILPFAPLPIERMTISRPFETSGIDFAGPLYTKPDNSGYSSQKVYIMFFTCAAIRAVHLELTPGLATESCLLGLRRFIARRGCPLYIYSDNARTFKRASKELSVLQNFLSAENLHIFLNDQQITWRFIVERAPWWGGFWERMVRSVKNVLKAVIRRSTLTLDELNTFLIEAEMIVNSRPLTHISQDSRDLPPLTPSHFLLGIQPHSLPTPMAQSSDLSHSDIRQLWVEHSRLTNFFWKRWKLEYLQQLRSLHHNKGGFSLNLKEGEIVLVHDSNVPRLFWKLAIVQQIYPGRDGKVRSCEIRLQDGKKMRRPVQLLYPLEITRQVPLGESVPAAEDIEKED